MAEILSANAQSLLKIKAHLDKEECAAIPTETVYGLAGNGFSEKACLKIFKAKNRPFFDPLILHTVLKTASLSPLDDLAAQKLIDLSKITPSAQKKINTLMQAFWPGPLTFILPKNTNVPDVVTSGLEKVAVRVPNHPLTLKLLTSLDFPLAAPSANRFGRVSPTTANDVEEELGNEIKFILDGGKCSVGVESTVLECSGDGNFVILRAGGTSQESLEKKLGEPVLFLNQHLTKTAAPGQLPDHYAPEKEVFLLPRASHLYRDEELEQIVNRFSDRKITWLKCSSQDDTENARTLFQKLREFDHSKFDVLIADPPETTQGLNAAVLDRLRKASRNKGKLV